jgi:VWFA-related protein
VIAPDYEAKDYMVTFNFLLARRKLFLIVTTMLIYCSASFAQDAGSASDAVGQHTPVIHVQSKLVVVDVIVHDEKGQPVLGLKRNNFLVEENSSAQKLRSFEPHSASDAQPAGPQAPKLPPGSFTNYTPLASADTLNILLIDTLNTSLKDQNYLRAQLQHYLDHAPSGQSVAIFGLTRQLLMLQGFTSDPKVLRVVLARKGVVRGSDLLEDTAGTNVDQQSVSDLMVSLGPSFAEIASNVQQFEAETQAFQFQLRAQYTLDAMNALAHYLSNFPGRKNIIWFSGSFPINLLPNPDINNGFSAMNLNAEEFQETTTLLGNAQASIYPIDARGNVAPPAFDVANSGRKYATTPSAITKDIATFNSSQAAAHTTMQAMADDTGGRAFFGTNDLSGAIAQTIDSGANYYTLAYSPGSSNVHGEYRRITVRLTDVPDAGRYSLSYRRGYYTDAPTKDVQTSNSQPSATPGATYRRVAMSHGAPAPEDIIFRVSAHPADVVTQFASAEGDQLPPGSTVKGPFRRITVRFTSLPKGITFTEKPDGRHDASVSFDVYVYAEDGTLLLTNGREIKLHLSPEQYQRVMDSVVSTELTVSVPAGQPAFLRMGVEDMPSGRFGAVEVSTRDLPASSLAKQEPAITTHH